jgi:type IV secretory pathway TraG/TraD family ATPase VirD4
MADKRAGRLHQPGASETPWLVALGIIAAAVMLGGAWLAAAWLGSTDARAAGTTNPLEVVSQQLQGHVDIGSTQLVLFGVFALILGFIGGLLIWALRKQSASRSRVDHLASKMSRARDFAPMQGKQAKAEAQRFGVEDGVSLGKLVNDGKPLFASWEWVQTWLMGPRAGKTSCVCIPQVVEAPGAVIATSNKRDIVDLTRGPRSRKGIVWVHDAQNIIGEEPSWWWNPLSFVRDMERAEALTDIFISSASSAGAKQDAYFESDGRRLLAHMLFAAAVTDKPITDVFLWAQDPDDKTPRNDLYEAGYPELAEALSGIQSLTPKQRDGVYGTMRPWVNVLSNERVIPWITDDGSRGRRPEFDHTRFATTTDTLFLISKEGAGTTRAIAAALAVAVLTEAEERAAEQPRGRLATPMMGVLDEVANVVRWRQLPDVYSHYGSRGIVLSSFFQSWDQGIEAFGEQGMRKLWSASNIRVAGSGLSDDKFLPFLSRIVGDHDVVRRTESTTGSFRRQYSSMINRERTLDESDISALPQGRAILSTSGMPPALLKLEHFSEKPYGDDCTESEAFYRSKVTQRAT